MGIMGVEAASHHPGFYEAEDANLTDTELVYHVRQALASVQQGDSDSYNQLVGVMHYTGRLAPDEVALLETSIKALSGAVTCIDMVHHNSLLSSVFSMSLWNYGPDVMDALVDLIISLAASSGKYLDSCLNMLVNNFIPPYYYWNKLSDSRVLAQKQEVLSRVHGAFKKISYLVPVSPLRLLPIIVQKMPTVHKKDHTIVMYVENLLKLQSSSIGEVIGLTILVEVIQRLRDLDVEIGWDDVVQDDLNKGIFDMELEDADDDAADIVHDGDEFPTGSISRKSLSGNISAELLDKLLVLMFEHFESCQNAGRLAEVFDHLLVTFESLILNTYKSKFSQFVMFYPCSLDPENCGVGFAGKLADIFISGSQPLVTRMSAVAYLASYLSRGKFLSASFVVTMLKKLVDWCSEYTSTSNSDIKPQAHRIFYSGCQAIMYVLCFRMRSIMDVPRLKSQLLLMPLQSVLKHKLNPLQVCLPSVVAEFLRQAKAAQLFTSSETFIFDDILESDLSCAFGGNERLDSFFPFDPCLLKTSDSFIRPNFVYWSMVKPTYEDDDEGDSSDDDAAEVIVNGENDDVDMMERNQLGEDNDLDYALNKMSITPKHSFKSKFAEHDKLLKMPSRIRPSMSPESS